MLENDDPDKLRNLNIFLKWGGGIWEGAEIKAQDGLWQVCFYCILIFKEAAVSLSCAVWHSYILPK